MRENDVIECPHCHEKSIAKRRSRMDGFRKVGELLECMLCHAELEALPENTEKPAKSGVPQTDALAALLGSRPESKPELHLQAEERRFCRDCAHYLKHPFLSRCTLRQTEVNPMGDCAAWSAPQPGKSS